MTHMLHIRNAEDQLIRKLPIDEDTYDMITDPETPWPMLKFDGQADGLDGDYLIMEWNDDERFIAIQHLPVTSITITIAE